MGNNKDVKLLRTIPFCDICGDTGHDMSNFDNFPPECVCVTQKRNKMSNLKVGDQVLTPHGKGKIVQKLRRGKIERYPWLVLHDDGYYEQYQKMELKLLSYRKD